MKQFITILRWILGIAIILFGLFALMVAEFLIGAVWVLCGLVILPPITQRVPPFKGRKVILPVSCVVLLLGVFLVTGEQDSAAPSQSGAVAETTPQQEVVQPEPIDAETLSTRMQEALNNRDITSDSVTGWSASVGEDTFFTVWKKCVAEGLNQQDLSQLPTVASYLRHAKDVYSYAYPEMTSSEMKTISEWTDALCSDVEEMENLQDQTSADLEQAAVSYGTQELYIAQRLDTTTSSEVLDALKDIWDAVAAPEDSSDWVAYNVEYIFGTAFPGNQIKIIHADSLNPFSEQGAWTISCYDTGETADVQNANGFTQTVPIYQLVENTGEFEKIIYDYRTLSDRCYVQLDEIVAAMQ